MSVGCFSVMKPLQYCLGIKRQICVRRHQQLMLGRHHRGWNMGLCVRGSCDGIRNQSAYVCWLVDDCDMWYRVVLSEAWSKWAARTGSKPTFHLPKRLALLIATL